MPDFEDRSGDADRARDAAAASDDQPGMLDDVPPSGDITPADAATRAEGPGLRQDPDEPRMVPASEDDIEVDAGSPQDYGDPNDDVVRGPATDPKRS
jgi:hypothetical protein